MRRQKATSTTCSPARWPGCRGWPTGSRYPRRCSRAPAWSPACSPWIGAAATGAGLSFAALLAAGANAVPAAIFVLGIGTFVHGLAPRYAVVAAYGIVAWSFLVEIIGAGIGASHWLLDTSVLHHIARAPAAGVRWDSAAILISLGIAAAVAGAVAFTRRDLQGA